MIADDNTSFTQCKKVATKIVNDALETKKISINDKDEFYNKDMIKLEKFIML